MIENAVESTAYLSFPPLDLVDEGKGGKERKKKKGSRNDSFIH